MVTGGAPADVILASVGAYAPQSALGMNEEASLVGSDGGLGFPTV